VVTATEKGLIRLIKEGRYSGISLLYREEAYRVGPGCFLIRRVEYSPFYLYIFEVRLLLLRGISPRFGRGSPYSLGGPSLVGPSLGGPRGLLGLRGREEGRYKGFAFIVKSGR
jgi:hypothetical protein